MNYAFDCILGIPWLVRNQPQIDWLARSVKRRQDFDVTEVFTHLLVAPRDWPHVTVVDGASTTHVVRRASDGPLCTTCAVLLTGDEDERRAVEHPWLPRMKNETVEQRLPYVKEAVEQWFPRRSSSGSRMLMRRSSSGSRMLMRRPSRGSRTTSRRLPHDDAVGDQELPPRVIGAVENKLSRLEEVDLPSAPTESDCTIEYVDGAPNHTRVIEVASPPRDAKSITSLLGLSSSEGTEPKSAREERFVAQSWESLKASGNPIYETAREFADVFPDKIPAELPADRGVRHEIDLTPGSKYCVTRQWPLPRDQVKTIDDFFEGRRQAGRVRESISPHSSPTFCVKKATGGWRIVHAFNN
ncbi:hypothetical protein PF005_g11796 [Phytophthora fragariae]|uniref:Reverse transcriptase RNase H-like domain-containing protein n=2 Tax=Phytophthora fragariae TaxID=53985 RepID=A0A6A3XYY5_9STRA|nr:hypothetical protein PF005_g11796 [Phytophthora fragariae]KAE9216974.1 hypothetical protein PF004_g14289 [Phytophthora fragariae]